MQIQFMLVPRNALREIRMRQSTLAKWKMCTLNQSNACRDLLESSKTPLGIQHSRAFPSILQYGCGSALFLHLQSRLLQDQIHVFLSNLACSLPESSCFRKSDRSAPMAFSGCHVTKSLEQGYQIHCI